MKAISILNSGDEAARLAMESLKAFGSAALLPLAYDSLLAAALAMDPWCCPVLLLGWSCAAEAAMAISAISGHLFERARDLFQGAR